MSARGLTGLSTELKVTLHVIYVSSSVMNGFTLSSVCGHTDIPAQCLRFQGLVAWRETVVPYYA